MENARRPEDLADLIARIWNAHDADDLGALFDDDGEWVTPYGQMLVGGSGITEGHRMVFEGIFARAVLTMGEVRTRTLSETLATLDIRWTMDSASLPDETVVPQRQGSMFLVTERRNETWHPLLLRNQEYAGPFQGATGISPR